MAAQYDPPQNPNTEQDHGQMSPAPLSSDHPPQAQAVRFASVNEEIEPPQRLQSSITLSTENTISNSDLSPDAQEELRNLSKSLQKSHLQHRRMSNFAFEPVSLPVSRVSHLHFKSVLHSSIRIVSAIHVSPSMYNSHADAPPARYLSGRFLWDIECIQDIDLVSQNPFSEIRHVEGDAA